MSTYYAYTEKEVAASLVSFVLMPGIFSRLFERRVVLRTYEERTFETNMKRLIFSGETVIQDKLPFYLKDDNLERRPLKQGFQASL